MSSRTTAAAFIFMLISCGATGGCGARSATSRGPLPFGYVDAPKANEQVRNGAPVNGWALSENGVAEVALYVDGRYARSMRLRDGRIDVAKVYPNMEDSEHSGWSGQLDTTTLVEGRHELVIQARSRKGATRDIASFSVTVAR